MCSINMPRLNSVCSYLTPCRWFSSLSKRPTSGKLSQVMANSTTRLSPSPVFLAKFVMSIRRSILSDFCLRFRLKTVQSPHRPPPRQCSWLPAKNGAWASYLMYKNFANMWWVSSRQLLFWIVCLTRSQPGSCSIWIRTWMAMYPMWSPHKHCVMRFLITSWCVPAAISPYPAILIQPPAPYLDWG